MKEEILERKSKEIEELDKNKLDLERSIEQKNTENTSLSKKMQISEQRLIDEKTNLKE